MKVNAKTSISIATHIILKMVNAQVVILDFKFSLDHVLKLYLHLVALRSIQMELVENVVKEVIYPMVNV